MGKHKTPPRRLPCSQANVKRALAEGRDQGIELTLTVMLYVLVDKFGFSDLQISRANQWFRTNTAAILDGSVKFDEMKTLLWEDYGWEINLSKEAHPNDRQ